MAWIFVCDRCQKASIDEGMLRRNGEHAGTITIDHTIKNKPSDINPEPDKVTLELCGECWNNHGNWVSGLDTIEPRHSQVPASG